ncbi:bifunctional tetrahydrofolate synthase/dihydrofolate synthase [Legionella maioricensis]|uniref:Dihydrofolate synthase/folylpolyglutamate synthase n=1 Tax=Legionella maioricensis TaxID=2896528 RepID=A0A9X2D1E3_9GAMM|nr:bifunctional tetrahydrofolate synthase/dihydrofolate synthase [Legionella maioricensis]MCL9684631.1 bifunctional tetrahydrofolate synthase/dihydrofolate synthase [Legionella maioricensis]MCL9687411.1 bifunctional tetrahydrofolate synthase/dihydrofolate synthase [Legionella maioricensis]
MHKPWSNWDLNQWLNSLENRNTQEIQLGLTRILEVAERINVCAFDCKVITVAGTNGKGSTVSALERIYHTAGYKVGAYTSPHLIHFNERIRVNLKPISDEDLCQAFNFIEDARDSVLLTYFEITTLAALLYFKQQNLDVIILEVGLGGRLDATNIIDADLSIITTIDYDHQDYLGSTLESIGYEKAGILRQGKPFIYADNNPPSSIIKVARDLATPCYFYDTDFSIDQQGGCWEFNWRGKRIKELPKPKIQLKSASAAIMACLLLDQELPVSQRHLSLAMEKVTIAGRLQFHQGSISILYDVAHNGQSARLLAETLKSKEINGQVHAVFSALKDKDILGLIFPLKDCVDRWYPAQLDNKRASSASLLCSIFEDAEIFVEVCYTSPLIAFQKALSQATAGDLIVVYGSFFTVGQVMAAQHNILEQKEIL